MEQLRNMQELVSADWRGREPPRQRHIGDLAWGWHTAGEGRRVKLWDGAWAWLDVGAAEIQVHPDLGGRSLRTGARDRRRHADRAGRPWLPTGRAALFLRPPRAYARRTPRVRGPARLPP